MKKGQININYAPRNIAILNQKPVSSMQKATM
jgi:hypothetical protein